jgi:HAE1 family hydrophobic/amphiphilic exporter-1
LNRETSASSLTINGENLPVVIVSDQGFKRGTVRDMTINVGNGNSVAIKDIVSFYETQTMPTISHDNMQRIQTINVTLKEGFNAGLVSRDIERSLDGFSMPSGFTYRMAGQNQMIMDSMIDLAYMMGFAIIVVFLIMLLQFGHFSSPFIVMFTIPLAFTGGLLSLWYFDFELSVISIIGFLLLTGVIVNNGIVFIDFINLLVSQGHDKRISILHAGATRLRPILVTTVTTVIGLLGTGLGIGEGAEILQSLAVVVIVGLSYATLMTLFVVPILYDLFITAKPNAA